MRGLGREARSLGISRRAPRPVGTGGAGRWAITGGSSADSELCGDVEVRLTIKQEGKYWV